MLKNYSKFCSKGGSLLEVLIAIILVSLFLISAIKQQVVVDKQIRKALEKELASIMLANSVEGYSLGLDLSSIKFDQYYFSLSWEKSNSDTETQIEIGADYKLILKMAYRHQPEKIVNTISTYIYKEK